MSKSGTISCDHKGNNLSFATFFPLCENIHLSKDAGLIPYILHRDYGYDSYLISYKNGDYPYLKTEAPGLKMIYMRPTNFPLKKLTMPFDSISIILKTVFDSIPVILKYGKKIDVFELYFFCMESIIIATIYKLINRRGFVYLKLDYVPDVNETYKATRENIPTRIKNSLFRMLLRTIFDIITVETQASYKYIKEYHPRLKWVIDRLYYVPNGIDVDSLSTLSKFYNKFHANEKENIILHIGRIGSHQKATDIVLEAFAGVARDFPNWRLVLVGIMDKGFTGYFNDFIRRNEDISDRVSYLGFLKGREGIYEYYWRSKILIFPSRWETFSIVPIEAGYFGDVILGSDIPCVMELTDNGKLGYLCTVDDIECFTNALKHMLAHEDELKEKSKACQKYIIKNFNWNKICGQLNALILRKMEAKTSPQ